MTTPDRADLGTVLVVEDDDNGSTTGILRLLTEEGFVVNPADPGPAAERALLEYPPDIVLLSVATAGCMSGSTNS